MIVSFRHKGLEKRYQQGSKKGVQADHVPKGHYSVWVNGNWRITFRFLDSDVELADYQDYH